MRTPRIIPFIFLVLSFIGFIDASWLSIEHFLGKIPPCVLLKGCDVVTTSSYSMVGPFPVAYMGALYYLFIFLCTVAFLDRKRTVFFLLARLATIGGLVGSVWFVYVQFAVLHAICIYCMVSASISGILGGISIAIFLKPGIFRDKF